MNIQEYLIYDLPPYVWALCGVTVAAMLYLLLFFTVALRRVSRRAADDSDAPLPDSGYPEVSVVVLAQGSHDQFADLLGDIYSQDYPAETEVIVVADGSCTEIERTVGMMQHEHSNLYLTVLPENSRNLSRRKLAITLGVKAARFDTVLLTEANCRIASDQWIRRMARHFAAGKRVVAGYAAINPEDDTEGAFRSRAFESTWEAVSWLAPAIAGYPRRGTGFNLAYSRELFFANKGFSNTLNLNFGDDDIFVSEIADRRNSTVELSEQARVVYSTANPAETFTTNRLRRRFTMTKVGGSFRHWASLAPWAIWILIGTGAAAIITGLPSLIPAAIAGVALLASLIPLAMTWRKTARALGARQLLLTVVPLMMWHPFAQIPYIIKGRKTRLRNYTWGDLGK